MRRLIISHVTRQIQHRRPWNFPGGRMELLTAGTFTSRPAGLEALAVLANLCG